MSGTGTQAAATLAVDNTAPKEEGLIEQIKHLIEKASEQELDSMSGQFSGKLATAYNRRVTELKEAREQQVLVALKETAEQHGFALVDLAPLIVGQKAPKKTKPFPLAPAKYRNPDDHSQTYAGRGPQPAWLKEALEKHSVTTAKELPDNFKNTA